MPVGRIEDLRFATGHHLHGASCPGVLIIDRGADLKPAAGLDHAPQDKETGAETLGRESAMIRVGDPSLPVEEGEQRALIDAA